MVVQGAAAGQSTGGEYCEEPGPAAPAPARRQGNTATREG
jgi:hypothetical protein